MKIDSHHHFWKYNPVEYGWIGEDMGALRHDFLPPRLQKEIALARIEGVISVQARQTLAETRTLLDFAREYEFVRGVVGWVPLASPDLTAHLEILATEPKLCGVRHVLQDEPDDQYMLRADFNAGIRALKRFDLVYDILIFERHLPQTMAFVDCHPSQIFVLDHAAKPRIKEGSFEPWNTLLRELARRENVFCKLSGLMTEAEPGAWTDAQLQPYMETVLEAFGPGRTLFGSDWPVCLLASGYQRWLQTVERVATALSCSEQAQLFGETAARVYGCT